MDVSAELRAAIKTTTERHEKYGDSLARNAAVMHALFPEGLAADSPKTWTQLLLMFNIATKVVRYAVSVEAGAPHIDSAHDLGVYAFMAERAAREYNDEQAARRVIKHCDPIAQALMNLADPTPDHLIIEDRRQARLALSLYLGIEELPKLSEKDFDTWLSAHRAAVLDEGPLSSREPYPEKSEPCGNYRQRPDFEEGYCVCGWAYRAHLLGRQKYIELADCKGFEGSGSYCLHCGHLSHSHRGFLKRSARPCNLFRASPADAEICLGCDWHVNHHSFNVTGG